jgi:hypothetical protein
MKMIGGETVNQSTQNKTIEVIRQVQEAPAPQRDPSFISKEAIGLIALLAFG